MSDNFVANELQEYQKDIHLTLTHVGDPSEFHWDLSGTNVQSPFIRFEVFMTKNTAADQNVQHNGILISFFDTDTKAQTIVNSGTPIVNNHRQRGYFIQSVDVNVNVNVPGAQFQGGDPQDKSVTGRVSSTSGFDVNGSVGFFGDSPTGQVGAGYTERQTTSYNYEGITIYNESTECLKHRYVMTGTDPSYHGDDFKTWEDLIWSKIFHHAELRLPVSELMGGDLPIISQGYWTIPLDYSGDVEIQVDMTLKMMLVLLHDTDSVGDWKGYYWSNTLPYTATIVRPWS